MFLGVDETEQVIAFENELERLVDRFRQEYCMTYASIIGVLHIKAHVLTAEALEDDTPPHTD